MSEEYRIIERVCDVMRKQVDSRNQPYNGEDSPITQFRDECGEEEWELVEHLFGELFSR